VKQELYSLGKGTRCNTIDTSLTSQEVSLFHCMYGMNYFRNLDHRVSIDMLVKSN